MLSIVGCTKEEGARILKDAAARQHSGSFLTRGWQGSVLWGPTAYVRAVPCDGLRPCSRVSPSTSVPQLGMAEPEVPIA